MKIVNVNQVEFGTGKPKICVPLTGKTQSEIMDEAKRATNSGADLIEWRIDWFDDVFDFCKLEDTARKIKRIIGDMPLLMTFRTKEEGGKRDISLEHYGELISEICNKKMAEMVDIEALKEETFIKNIVSVAIKNDLVTVGSNHDFDKTPSKEEIISRLCKMQELGLHITKIAVMPQKERDVLTLLDATLAMKETYADRPFITMSMSKKGLISRLAGECFGTCLTFGTAGAASAPGQIDAKELNHVLDLLHE